MSKIVEEIRDQVALEIVDSSQPAVYTVPEFNRAVRLAYNRAIDDAKQEVAELVINMHRIAEKEPIYYEGYKGAVKKGQLHLENLKI